jgi:glycine cleavage system aminomethyltransferase T
VVELAPVRGSVIRCFGAAGALDSFPPLGTASGRVAPDELWLFGPARAAPDMARRAGAYLAGADPDGVVVDHGEAWAIFALSGPRLSQAMARVADFPVSLEKDGFAQGAVVQVPAKLLALSGRLYLVVPAQLAHHVPARLLEACADLAPTIGLESEMESR